MIPSGVPPTSTTCNSAFTTTAISMDSTARRASPIAVRHAESVSTAASDAAETDISRNRLVSSVASCAESAG